MKTGVLISSMALSPLFAVQNLLAAFNNCVFFPILNVKDFQRTVIYCELKLEATLAILHEFRAPLHLTLGFLIMNVVC